MSAAGDVALTRLASYSSPGAMPVSSRLSYTSYASLAARSSPGRAASLERGSYAPLPGRLGARLSPAAGCDSRRPPLPSGEYRRSAARAAAGRREPSADSDTLTEARRYLQQRRERLGRAETSAAGAADSAVSRLLQRLDAEPAADARRWRASSESATPASRERIVPITVQRCERLERQPSVAELRRQLDAASLAESPADETAKPGSQRVLGIRIESAGRPLPGRPIAVGLAGRQSIGPSSPPSDQTPSSPSGRRIGLASEREPSSLTSAASSRRQSEELGGGGGGGGGRAPRPGADSSRQLGLTGLRNIGNTCFMNSVLQCLSNTRALHDYILRDAFSSDINGGTSATKGSLIKAFAALMSDLWKRSDDPDRVLTTAPFKAQIQRFAPRFVGYQQQDAQEFLRYLLEGLHEDVNRVTSRPKPITTDIDDALSTSQMSMEAWKRFLRFENSKFVDLFVGQLKSTLRCTVCGHASVTFDPFWDLSLPIPSKSGQQRLQACFDLFTKEEVLDGDEKPTCSRCQKRQKCTKSFSIQKFPRILVVHLKRFSPMERFRGKLGTAIDFPVTGLDLSAYSAGQAHCQYNLYGVANHSGTLFSGHYTAHCRHPYSGEWYEYNDSRVRPISVRAVAGSEAYVLFYELAGPSHL